VATAGVIISKILGVKEDRKLDCAVPDLKAVG
jgi:hypothetical protein